MKTENLTIDRRYGRALFEAAKEGQNLDVVFEELATLQAVYQDVPEMGALLTDERLTTPEKKQLFKSLENQFGDMLSRFLNVVFNHRRMTDIPQIISEFNNFYHADKGILVAEVISATELTDAQCEKIEAKIANKFDCQKVRLDKSVDPELIGGFIINVANKVIDSSVKRQLATMHQQLVK